MPIPERTPSQPALTYKVQDLSLGGMLDHTLYLCRDNWLIILVASIIWILPFEFATIVAMLLTGTDEIDPLDPMIGNEQTALIFMGITMVQGILVTVLATPLASAVIYRGVVGRYTSQPVSIGECLKGSLRYAPSLIVAAILTNVLIGIGSMLCILPGIFVGLYLYIAGPIIVLEGAGPIRAMQRSGELMWGFMIMVFVADLAAGILIVPLTMLSSLIAESLLYILIVACITPVMVAFKSVLAVVVYCAARSRSENMDLDLLVNEVDVVAAAPGATL
jgi:hypothetical protein